MDRLERRPLLLEPSYSQIYTELKKLESLGLVTSRVERDEGTRSRRLYKITPAGMAAVTDWTNNAPVDPPVLKHSVLLRVTFGHLSNPARLKELLQEHVAYAEGQVSQSDRGRRGRRGRTRLGVLGDRAALGGQVLRRRA